MNNRSPYQKLLIVSIWVLIFLITQGCTNFQSRQEPSAEPEEPPSPSYYDFGDVLVPAGMTINKKESFIYKVSSKSTGILSLKGRIDMDSLIRFFAYNMEKDNWTRISSNQGPRSLMLYMKENRWCVIKIYEDTFYTYAEIWVAPKDTSIISDTLSK